MGNESTGKNTWVPPLNITEKEYAVISVKPTNWMWELVPHNIGMECCFPISMMGFLIWPHPNDQIPGHTQEVWIIAIKQSRTHIGYTFTIYVAEQSGSVYRYDRIQPQEKNPREYDKEMVYDD